MLIIIGSTNQVKVQAVQEVLKDYPPLHEMEIVPFAAPSQVGKQPLSLEEIICGAKNRAKNAFLSHEKCIYSFGIESGLFEAIGTNTGFLEACICVIFDGFKFFTGLSCGFEVPPLILQSVLKEKMDLSEACYHSGITENKNLGAAEGLIGMLTRGRVNRKEYTKQSIVTALLQLENAHLYKNDH